jgi:hypothetical protein
MSNYDFGTYGGSTHQSAHGEPDDGGPRRHSVFSLIAMIAVVTVITIIGLSVAFWALSLLFHLAGLIVKVAIVAAVAALVWRRCCRRRSQDHV